MEAVHNLIFLGGLLGGLCILAGAFAARFKAPLLLIFLVLGMLAGEDGPGGIVFNDFHVSYLLGSLALVVILFQGGLSTHRAMVRISLRPAALLATLGVVISATVISVAVVLLFHLSWPEALLVGAAVAPTDAAAVATLLRLSGARVPDRVAGILELESGLNDPISVVLMVLGVDFILHPASMDPAGIIMLVLREMIGGAVLGIAGGYALLWLLRRLKAEQGIYPVLALAGAMVLFGGAQSIEASGFLAVYIAGFIVNDRPHENAAPVTAFFDAFSWAAQIGLFLLLGLLVTPHDLLRVIVPALEIAALLILVARPLAALLCLGAFRIRLPEIGFISWVGLRGAVPIYLTLIPVLAGVPGGQLLFGLVFVVVVTSLVIQGWTVGLAARVFGFVNA